MAKQKVEAPRRRLVTALWVVEEDSVQGSDAVVTTERYLEVEAVVGDARKRYRLNAFGGVQFFEVPQCAGTK